MRGRGTLKLLKLRESAEKAWNAAVQVANAVALKYLGLISKSKYEGRKALRTLSGRFLSWLGSAFKTGSCEK